MSVMLDDTVNTTGCIGDYCCPWRQNQNQNYQYGWVCPKCGRVYSPTTSSCPFCGPGVAYSITATNTNIATAEVTPK